MGSKLSKLSSSGKNHTRQSKVESESPLTLQIREWNIAKVANQFWIQLLLRLSAKEVNRIIVVASNTLCKADTGRTPLKNGCFDIVKQISEILKILDGGSVSTDSGLTTVFKVLSELCKSYRIDAVMLTQIWNVITPLIWEALNMGCDIGVQYCLDVTLLYIISMIFDFDINDDCCELTSQLSLSVTVDDIKDNLDTLLSVTHRQSSVYASNKYTNKYLCQFLQSKGEPSELIQFAHDYFDFQYSHKETIGFIERCLDSNCLDIFVQRWILSETESSQTVNQWQSVVSMNEASVSAAIAEECYESVKRVYFKLFVWLDNEYSEQLSSSITQYIQPTIIKQKSQSKYNEKEDSIQL